MITKITLVTVVVHDQREALRWYMEKLGFEKRMDAEMGSDQKWITVAPKEQKEVQLVLASWKWYGTREESQVGRGTVMVLESSDCRKDYESSKAKGVKFTQDPEESPWGTSAVFVDLDGNPFNLLQPKT